MDCSQNPTIIEPSLPVINQSLDHKQGHGASANVSHDPAKEALCISDFEIFLTEIARHNHWHVQRTEEQEADGDYHADKRIRVDHVWCQPYEDVVCR